MPNPKYRFMRHRLVVLNDIRISDRDDSASASQPETAFNTAEGWARDVTEDIAHAVLDRARIDAQSLTAHRSFWKGC